MVSKFLLLKVGGNFSIENRVLNQGQKRTTNDPGCKISAKLQNFISRSITLEYKSRSCETEIRFTWRLDKIHCFYISQSITSSQWVQRLLALHSV
jgi:hypothetical protein